MKLYQAASAGILAYAIFFSVPGALAGTSDHERVCAAAEKCRILAGGSGAGEPPLAKLVDDIVALAAAPEQNWVHTRERPPLDVSLPLGRALQSCYAKATRLSAFLLPSCLGADATDENELNMIDSPLPWPPERTKLMKAYLKHHTGNDSEKLEEPTTIVTHWTDSGPGTLEAILKGFGATTMPDTHDVNVSCHYIVDRDGTVYRLMPENLIARHTVGLNRNALCIENIGGPSFPLTPQQRRANELLINGMVARHPTIDNMIGHSEYRAFENSMIFTEKTAYRGDRWAEPGRDYLRKLRADLDARSLESRKAGHCAH
ncbi:MAG: N-acetylmuramoyl-L-alanine amidase [Deltaproteobacteria bacterium]|nr:N-acetylmuramoyl-L-alanine amidase [Deltaproteobacteria bacterium]